MSPGTCRVSGGATAFQPLGWEKSKSRLQGEINTRLRLSVVPRGTRMLTPHERDVAAACLGARAHHRCVKLRRAALRKAAPTGWQVSGNQAAL